MNESLEFHSTFLSIKCTKFLSVCGPPFKHLFGFKFLLSLACNKNTCTVLFDLSFDLLQLEVKLKSYYCKVYTLISISQNNRKKRILFPTATTTTTSTVSNLNINRGDRKFIEYTQCEKKTQRECERDSVFKCIKAADQLKENRKKNDKRT